MIQLSFISCLLALFKFEPGLDLRHKISVDSFTLHPSFTSSAVSLLASPCICSIFSAASCRFSFNATIREIYDMSEKVTVHSKYNCYSKLGYWINQAKLSPNFQAQRFASLRPRFPPFCFVTLALQNKRNVLIPSEIINFVWCITFLKPAFSYTCRN